MEMHFKRFILNEQHEYLGHKVGDLLTSVHELVQGGKQVGARQLVKHTEGLVNQIRKILHTSWPRTEYKFLRRLQKCGVALMKCIDEKGDLTETLNSVRAELEDLSHKIGAPINKLGSKPKKQDKPEQAEPQQPPASQQQPASMIPPPTGLNSPM